MKKYSIIVPVFNSEKYLKKCLNSIVLQTYKNIEIIIIDDGSKDNSGEICNQYAKKDNRIKVFHQENKGVSNARNTGIEKAEGEYIIFIDSDDWINRNTLEIIDEKIEFGKNQLLMYKVEFRKKNRKGIKVNDRDNFLKILRKILINETINSPVNKVYNREIINENNIRFKENIPIAEDLLFNVRYFSCISSFEMIEDELYYYNQENQFSLTKSYNANKYYQLMEVDNEIDKILSKYNNKKLIKSAKYIRIKNIFSCIIDLNRKQCSMTSEEKKEFIKKMQGENRVKIITMVGIRPFIYSCIYNLIRSPKILLYLAKRKGNKK